MRTHGAATAQSTQKTISGRAVLLVLAVMLTIGLAVNWYNNDQQDKNVDRLTDQIEQIDG